MMMLVRRTSYYGTQGLRVEVMTVVLVSVRTSCGAQIKRPVATSSYGFSRAWQGDAPCAHTPSGHAT
jgi:hypothetical protein